MSKVMQVKIRKEDIDEEVADFIKHRIAEVCKKQKIDAEIQYEIDQAVIEVMSPEYDSRLMKIEKYLKNKFKDFGG